MLKISDEIASYTRTLFPEETPNKSIKILIEKEFVRRLAGYRHLIRIMEQKYQVDFDKFKEDNLVEKHKYSFEVENDYCDWEMAIDGVKTIEKKLFEIRGQ